jgi:Uma2 family endonuclease
MVAPEKKKLYTMDEFLEFAARPENADREFEFIDGEIIEVMPSRTYNSGFALRIAARVEIFCDENQLPCYMSGADGAYRILDNILVPDFAYKRTPLSKDYPDPDPPLWVVEVLSPTDEPGNIKKKRGIYRQAKILLWELDADQQTVEVYAPGKDKRTFGIDDTLDGGDVVPGFTLAVRVLFRS